VDSKISEPMRCDFISEALLCGPNVTDQTAEKCLAAAHIAILHNIYNVYLDTNQQASFPSFDIIVSERPG